MHGKKEVDEQVAQYCIQKNENSKYLTYLQCFLNASDSAGCLKQAKIDQTKLNKCINETDKLYNITKNFNDQSSYLSGQFPLFDIDKVDNDKYGVGGSPTLVINGVDAQVSRSPATLLSAVCGAFNSAPSECSQELSAASPSPGFGYNTQSGADTAAANCGF
jgi:hypothetical protein